MNVYLPNLKHGWRMERSTKRAKLSSENPYSAEELANIKLLNILIVGAGGLGCEIIKNLAVAGFRKLTIVDMDTIELTNLNRQFLFTDNDIGKYKAEIAAKKIHEMVPECYPQSCVSAIEALSDSFFEQFHIVVCGLDSVFARRYINAKIVGMCLSSPDPASLRPIIDGGSQGFRGQCRVILPGITPCYECTLSLLTDEKVGGYPLCTIASIPRLPEHCIEWSSVVAWPREFGRDSKPDLDNERDAVWLYETALARSKEFDIDGVTLNLVYGVSKRLVPAIASTNAIIAGVCCVEVLKLAMGNYAPLDNYFMYAGDSGTYSSVFPFEKRNDCPVCGCEAGEIRMQGKTLLKDLLEEVSLKLHCSGSLPSLSGTSNTYYMDYPPNLQQKTSQNLMREIGELCVNGEELVATHPKLPSPARIRLYFR